MLVDEKILPDPDRHAPKGVQTPWRTFIAIHMNVMVACGFFCKTVWTPLGREIAYVLAFIPQAAEIEAGAIRCRRWLGGLLKHYYRRAA